VPTVVEIAVKIVISVCITICQMLFFFIIRSPSLLSASPPKGRGPAGAKAVLKLVISLPFGGGVTLCDGEGPLFCVFLKPFAIIKLPLWGIEGGSQERGAENEQLSDEYQYTRVNLTLWRYPHTCSGEEHCADKRCY